MSKDEEYDVTKDILTQLIPLSPKAYRIANPEPTEEDEQEPMNEMREIAGLPHDKVSTKPGDLKAYLAKAGL